MEYIDLHAHMVSRTTDDYRAMAMTGCVAVTEPAFWAGYDRPGVDAFARLLQPPDRLRAEARRHLRHRPLHVAVPESRRRRRTASWRERCLAIIPEFLDRPNVLGIGEIGLNRVTRNELAGFKDHVDLAMELRPADPHPHAAPRGQVEGHEGHRRDARRRQPDHAAPRDGRPRRGAHGRHDPRQRVLDRPDALPGDQGHARPRDRHDRDAMARSGSAWRRRATGARAGRWRSRSSSSRCAGAATRTR